MQCSTHPAWSEHCHLQGYVGSAGTYMYMAPELDLASVQAALLQPLLLMSAEMRDVSSEGGVGAGHCWQQVQELRVATELQISRPDYAYKANIFSVGMLLLQVSKLNQMFPDCCHNQV